MTFTLITRPIESATLWAKELQGIGRDVIVSPLLQYREVYCDYNDVANSDVLVFSSREAVRIFGRNCKVRNKHILAIGEKTAEEAIKIGFEKPLFTGKNSLEMEGYVMRNCRQLQLLHLCGEEASIKFLDRKVIYKADFSENFTAAALLGFINGVIDTVTILSPRTAENYINLLKKNNLLEEALSVRTICISANAAKPLQDKGFKNIAISLEPDVQTLSKLL